jgi:hypothetical protein
LPAGARLQSLSQSLQALAQSQADCGAARPASAPVALFALALTRATAAATIA